MAARALKRVEAYDGSYAGLVLGKFDELAAPQNSYATDGRCHNANRGSFGHECGRPATWIGTKANGFRSGFCDRCKEIGDEARAFTSWQPA